MGAFRTIITPTKVCVFVPATSGDPDAPFFDPTNNVRAITFDGRFGYYQVAASADPVIPHLAVPPDGGKQWSGDATIVLTYTGRVTNSFVLITHGLGYVPRFKVSDVNNALVTPARPIQKVTSGGFTGYRTVRFRATTTQIILDEIAIPGQVGLTALTTTYHVRVFQAVGPVSGKHGFLGTPSAVEMAQGAVDSMKRSLRVAQSGEAHMIKPFGRASDINDGQFRFVTGDGTVYDTDSVVGAFSAPYAGSFPGPPLLDVVL